MQIHECANWLTTVMMLCLMPTPADKINAQPAAATGIFDAATDVGKVLHPGSSRYDPLSEQYMLRGAGRNMWFDNDEFHFLWKRIHSDFALYSWLSFVGEGVDPHRKAGLMIRESLQPNAPYVSAAYHGDGLVALQYRSATDTLTREIRAGANFLPILKLEKRGNTIRVYAAAKGQPLQRVGEVEIDFNQPDLHAGLFVCSHHPDVVEEAVFSNTRLTIPAKPDFIPYRDYIGSRLEILTVETGRRDVVYQSAQPFEAPNWSRDGQFLVVNSRGKLYRIPAAGGEPERIETDFADANNNDHGFSPNSQKIAFVSNTGAAE